MKQEGAVKKLPMIRARPKAGLEVCFFNIK